MFLISLDYMRLLDHEGPLNAVCFFICNFFFAAVLTRTPLWKRENSNIAFNLIMLKKGGGREYIDYLFGL